MNDELFQPFLVERARVVVRAGAAESRALRTYDAPMIAVGFVYSGFLVALIGLLSLAKPLRVARIRSRRQAAAVLIAGVVLVAAGALLPAHETTIATQQTLLDQFAPVFQFQEVHTTRIAASRERV